jgi:hypothetical protein
MKFKKSWSWNKSFEYGDKDLIIYFSYPSYETFILLRFPRNGNFNYRLYNTLTGNYY